MRLSIYEDDPGYDRRALGSCKVFVDGVDVTDNCYTADEEEGKAWCRKRNELGNTFIDPATGEVANEVLTGRVEIFLTKQAMNGYDTHPCN